MVLFIRQLGGVCPVQAEGTFDGTPFYFRARGQHWSIGVGGDIYMKPDWHVTEPYGDSEFAAGWMEEDVAHEIIETTYKKWREIEYYKPVDP